jgi:glucose-1-phosphate thymidylyltransferase
MVVTGAEHCGDVFAYCGDGSKFGCNFNFAVQEQPNGIAGALALCEIWAGKDQVTVVLGDNIFDEPMTNWTGRWNGSTCYVFLKDVANPERFGVAKIRAGELVEVVEKPEHPPSSMAVTGAYIFPNDVWRVIGGMKPSERGELEVTDIINYYIQNHRIQPEDVDRFWSDAGTMESYRAANEWAWRQK